MGGFLSAIFGGQNKTLNKDINQFGQDAGVAGNLGTGDATAASKFYQDVLSGDPTKQAEAIAPETKAAQDQAAQAKATTAQFAPRSGGTAATTAGIDATTRANLISLLGGLKTTAASGASTLGTAEQSLSQQATGKQAELSQEQMQNWLNSILGKGISTAAGAAESFGLGKLFPMAKGLPPGATDVTPGSDAAAGYATTDSPDLGLIG